MAIDEAVGCSTRLDYAAFPALRRRGFLMGAAAMTLVGTPVLAADEIGGPGDLSPTEFWSRPRTVWLKRKGVGEDLRATYWADGQLVLEEYRRICVFMRDLGFENAIRSGDARIVRAVRAGALPAQIPVAVPVSVRLLDAIYAIGGWLEHFGVPRPVGLTSAYRHPFYNNNMVEGAARDGYHTKGRAGDLVIEGVSPQRISQFGAWLGVGGIGLYASKGFTHVDDGAQRFWRGK